MEKTIEENIIYFGDYHKYWIHDKEGNRLKNPDFFSGIGAYVLSLKNAHSEGINYYANLIVNDLKERDNIDFIVAVPSSKKDIVGAGIVKVLEDVQLFFDKNIVYKQFLRRIKDIEKLSNGGNRECKVHYDSLELINVEDIKDKCICLYDDVTSSGNSLMVCKELLLQAGAKKVYCFALGKTVAKEYNDNDINIAKNINKLDKFLQYVIDMEIDSKDIIGSLIKKFILIENSFSQLDLYLKNKDYYIARKKELYRYIHEQYRSYKNIYGYEFWEEYDLILEAKLYEKLIFECNDFKKTENYFKLLEEAIYEFGAAEHRFLEFMHKFCSKEVFSIDRYSIKRILKNKCDVKSRTSEEYNEIAKALYSIEDKRFYEDALKYINLALNIDNENRILYYNKSLILRNLNMLNDSYKCLKKASELNSSIYSEDFWFPNAFVDLLSWLKELNEFANTAETNYLIGEFLCEYGKKDLAECFYKRRTNSGNNMELFKFEKEAMKYLDLAYLKKPNEYRKITIDDIINKSENRFNEISNSLRSTYNAKLFKYKPSLIDVWLKEQNKAFEDDLYVDSDVGPFWLGGTETEEEFWEH